MMAASACPPGPLNGERQILNYSKFVVTQIFDQNAGCVISPNMDPQAAAYCGTCGPQPPRGLRLLPLRHSGPGGDPRPGSALGSRDQAQTGSVTGRLLASLLVCALVLGAGAGAGFGEPRPAERIMPVDVLPLAAGSPILPEPPPTVGPLRKVDVERPAPPAATGTSPAFSVDHGSPFRARRGRLRPSGQTPSIRPGGSRTHAASRRLTAAPSATIDP